MFATMHYTNWRPFPLPLTMILQAIRTAAHEHAPDGSELTPLELFAFFVSRCRKNLHVIIAFSPIGDAFRNHIRQYPSLINCCSIDWFDVSTSRLDRFLLQRRQFRLLRHISLKCGLSVVSSVCLSQSCTPLKPFDAFRCWLAGTRIQGHTLAPGENEIFGSNSLPTLAVACLWSTRWQHRSRFSRFRNYFGLCSLFSPT